MIKRNSWVFFVAIRYLRSRGRDRLLGPSFLAMAGIAVGVMALVSVLGVMNGFQLGFIEDILNINSFHIRVYSDSQLPEQSLIDDIEKQPEVSTVLPFIDIQTLIKGDFSDYEAVFLRAVPDNLSDYDPVMAGQLDLQQGTLVMNSDDDIILGALLASRLGAGIGDRVSLVSMEGNSFGSLKPADRYFRVTGIFKSGYYDYDRTMGFTRLSAAGKMASGSETVVYGVKLKNRYHDRETLESVSNVVPAEYSAVSWREFNSSFFGALRTEKIAMMLLIGLIFIVVGVNIKHALERSVLEKKEEIGILMSLGGNRNSIKMIFITEGLIIGLSGAAAGLLLGFLITSNINGIFRIIDILIDKTVKLFQYLIIPFSGRTLHAVHMFSPRNFYITEVPVRIIFSEVFFVFMFAVFASVAAAYTASRTVSGFRPSEVLRYE